MSNKLSQSKILLIEDEEILSKMYFLKFSKEGFETILAKDGEEGLKLAKEEKPDVILLDIILPKLDGFSILKSLKEDVSTRDIPVLLLSNLGQDEDVKKGLSLGAVDYLIKANYTPTQVVEKVKRVIESQTV
jgi:DNA-binding response OmpR family regulator